MIRSASEGGIWFHYKNKIIKLNNERIIQKEVEMPEEINFFHLSASEQVLYATNKKSLISFNLSTNELKNLYPFNLPLLYSGGQTAKIFIS
jgi:hypothetical protein